MYVATTQLLGDVDGDGDIDQADALLLYAHIAINYIPSRWLAVADIDKDGSITLTDVFYIGAYILDPTNPDLPSGIGESTGIEIDESPSVEHPLPDSLGLIDYPDNPLQVEPGQTPQTAYVLQSVDAVRSQIDEGEFDYFRITLDDAAVIMVRGYVNGEHGAIDFSLHDHTGTMIGDEEWVSSLDSGSGQAALHMVQAWAVHNRLVLGQFHCAEALEEITIIPELLRLLDLKGCIGTTDALGCHKSTAEQVVEQAADYVRPSRPINPNSTPISNTFLTALTQHSTPIPP